MDLIGEEGDLLFRGEGISAKFQQMKFAGVRIINAGEDCMNAGENFINTGLSFMNAGIKIINAGTSFINAGTNIMIAGTYFINAGASFMNEVPFPRFAGIIFGIYQGLIGSVR